MNNQNDTGKYYVVPIISSYIFCILQLHACIHISNFTNGYCLRVIYLIMMIFQPQVAVGLL